MHALIWPQTIKPEPHGVARFGRVLHWLFAAVGFWLVVWGVWLFASAPAGENSWNASACIIAGAVFFMFARALRYIFSGE